MWPHGLVCGESRISPPTVNASSVSAGVRAAASGKGSRDAIIPAGSPAGGVITSRT